MKYSRWLTIGLSLAIMIFIISFSIAVPILCRPFYYAQIDSLDLEKESGLTRTEIVKAYDEMMDFCIGIKSEFSTGVLKWSESGKSHFVDVKRLFILDIRILVMSSIVLTGWIIGKRKISVRPYKFQGRGPAFWGGAFLFVCFGIIGGFAAVDFDKAFTLFHTVFFPGKDNWWFDPNSDQIILVLPQEFFANCAILIVVLIILLCLCGMITDICYGRKNKTATRGR